MKIYEASVKKPVTTALIFIGVVIFGLFSHNRSSIDLYPEIELNVVMVITNYPGASAEDIETNGMVVDDAIVVLENITTHIERGSKPRDASIYGTNEVAVAVMASTLTIVAVFLPFTMVSGLAGMLFRQLGWMVSITITLSVICALTLTPMMASRTLKAAGRDSRIYRPIRRMLDRLDGWYEGVLTWCVRHRVMVAVAAVCVFISSLFLSSRIGSEFIPASDNVQITATVELPVGTRVQFSREAAAKGAKNLQRAQGKSLRTLR